MYKILLLNLPFAALHFPSLGLTQLKAAIQCRFSGRVDVEIVYLNHEFARLTGSELYQEIATSVRHHLTGLGDWLFRQSAFPDSPENSREYFLRCYPHKDAQTVAFRHRVEQLRREVDRWLVAVISQWELDRADLVGFTSMFNQNVPCFALARKLKQRDQAITTVMGGANCEYPMGAEIARSVDFVDFIFSGSALVSFPKFLELHLADREGELDQIDGVFSRRNAAALLAPLDRDPGSRETGPPAARVFGEPQDVNTPIPLDYGGFLVVANKVASSEEVPLTLLFETSRGCWWGERAHCTFCGLNGLTMKYRSMRPAAALEQFARLFRYADKVPRLRLQSVDNIMPKEYLREVFPVLEPPANTAIFYELRSDLTEKDIATLAKARVTLVQPGIESLATSTLKLMRKGTTAFQNIRFLQHCRLHGVVPLWNLLIGFPGEGSAVYAKYMRELASLVHLPPPTGVYPVRFDRYSPYFVNPAEFGLDLRPCDFYELIYPLPQDRIENLAYYFIDNNFDARYFVEMVQWIGPLAEKIACWRARYSGEDGRPPAALDLEESDGGIRVHDTRDGTPRDYAIRPAACRILGFLARPATAGRIAAEFPDFAAGELDRELAWLRERELVFEEDGRLLSLVLPRP